MKRSQRKLRPTQRRHATSRAKGRRLPTRLCEDLSVRFQLTIECAPGTSPRVTKDGAVYVREDEKPDLRIRASGDAGVDIALLTRKANRLVSIGDNLGTLYPLWIECKNDEKWDFGSGFYATGASAFIDAAYLQIIASARHAKVDRSHFPVVVLSKNRWPTLVVLPRMFVPLSPRLSAYRGVRVETQHYTIMPWEAFVVCLGSV